MASLKERVTAPVERLRERFEWFDHVLRMVKHYGSVNGNAQSGAVTYFGFLSFFPILALGFFVIGLIAQCLPRHQGADGPGDQQPAARGDRTGPRARSR